MATIQQFGVDIVPVEDRLLLKMNAAGAATMRFWLTRRFLALFWKGLTEELRKTVAEAKSVAARDFLLDMAETRLTAKADFATAFEDRAAVRPPRQAVAAAPTAPAAAAAPPPPAAASAASTLPPPRLLWGFNIKRQADARTAIVLIATDNARIDIALADDGLFGLMRILRDAAAKAEWELPLAWGAGMPGAVAHGETRHLN
ncbi:MAG: hypothetical protein C6Y20_16815 [Tagaea sp. CACIAM 22H2]|nr:hypothetical protein [Tagaea sp. CACIAM 22H2]